MEQHSKVLQRAKIILRRLAKQYPDAHCALNFQSPLQLLVATILSAQCTDVRVNLVTPALFDRFPNAQAFATAHAKEIERLIQSAGFFRTKTRSIQECCRQITSRFAGQVPNRLEDLVTLPGVGRKTANVVLGNAFNIPGITVDTHVGRLSRRMALTVHVEPEKVEQDLMKLVPRKQWTLFSHRMIYHGRQICLARKPACDACVVNDVCPKVGVKKP